MAAKNFWEKAMDEIAPAAAPKKPGAGGTGERLSSPPAEAAIDQTRDSVRVTLSPQDFSARAETKRLHGDDSTISPARLRFNDILDKDPKFNFRPEVKEHLKRLFFHLVRSARKESADDFYKKFNHEKFGSGTNKTARDLFLTNFSLWLMMEKFDYDPAVPLSQRQGKKLPVWTVIKCNHDDLMGERPLVAASQGGLNREVRVQLVDVFYGLKKFPFDI